MHDIVERLRTTHSVGNWAICDDQRAEAADEIERLRQRVKELGGYKEAWVEAQRGRSAAERELAALKAGELK